MDLIAEVVDRLKVLEPQKIILFGSYAYGEPKELSDVDIFIVKEGIGERRAFEVKARKLLRDIRSPFDIFVDTPQNVEFRLKKVKDQFYEEVFSKGKVIYAK
ncbi:MAG: hypothetical protein C6H99_07070 [Epsilonproteobacteria bacterium]|nr:hypothetical protein [Campylobacterota bacterium]NPA64647.1 nucleotidyltransferase domain-containing protein [Campylobacterota bacterium]